MTEITTPLPFEFTQATRELAAVNVLASSNAGCICA